MKAKVNLVADSPNSAVPIPPEDYKAAGTYDSKHLLGVITMDVEIANTLRALSSLLYSYVCRHLFLHYLANSEYCHGLKSCRLITEVFFLILHFRLM